MGSISSTRAGTTRADHSAEGLSSTAASGAGSARVRAVAFIPTATFALGEEDRYLVVTQLLPPTLAANALAVQAAYREYQQRALARGGLRKMYIGTLTLALVLAVFGALLLAVVGCGQAGLSSNPTTSTGASAVAPAPVGAVAAEPDASTAPIDLGPTPASEAVRFSVSLRHPAALQREARHSAPALAGR